MINHRGVMGLAMRIHPTRDNTRRNDHARHRCTSSAHRIGPSTPRSGTADKTVMGASRTGSYEVTPPGRSRAGDALAEPTNPAQDSQIASASGGSHPTSSAAYILILTASGMAQIHVT